MMELIIAHYKENLDWLNNTDIKYTVYNKFEGSNLLPNVGRESHTYLNHIVNNYDNLSDYTIFLQGDPIAHCKNLFERLEHLKLNANKYQYFSLSDGVITCDGNGRPHCGEKHLPIAKLYEYLFEKTSPEVFICNSAGQFFISKETIYRNSKKFYEKCLLTLSYDSNPIEGFCMERLWTSIFGIDNTYKRSDIQYHGDECITIDKYFSECFSKDGSFIHLGQLGFLYKK